MTPIYSPDCDCGLIGEHPQVRRVIVHSHDGAATAFSSFVTEWRAAEARSDSSRRYWVVHGPGGHVVGVG